MTTHTFIKVNYELTIHTWLFLMKINKSKPNKGSSSIYNLTLESPLKSDIDKETIPIE